MAIDQPPEQPVPIDTVVASNVRRLREARRLSRTELADHLTELTGARWSRWKLVDIEGARSPTTAPRPATWTELTALARALDVTIYDLVLPEDDTTEVELTPVTQAEQLQLDGSSIPTTVEHAHTADRDHFTVLLFATPGRPLTPASAEEATRHHDADLIQAAHHIAETQHRLDQAIARLEQLIKHHERDHH